MTVLRKSFVLSLGLILNGAVLASEQDPVAYERATSVRHGHPMALSPVSDAIFRTFGAATQACLSSENRAKAVAFAKKYPEHISSTAVVCIAALTHEDMDLMVGGANPLDVLGAAQKRFANENGVPEVFAGTFTQMMGKKLLLPALKDILASVNPDLNLESICRTAGEKEFKFLIQAMGLIGPDPCDMDARQDFLEQFAKSSAPKAAVFEEVADGFLKNHVAEEMLKTVPVPVKMRALTLRQTQVNLMDMFGRLQGMDQDEALALISLYKHREDLRPDMWDLQKILSASYLDFLVRQRYGAARHLTGAMLLACGEIEKETMVALDALEDDEMRENKLNEIVFVRSTSLLQTLFKALL